MVQVKDSNIGPFELNIPQNLIASTYDGIMNVINTNVELMKSQLDELQPSSIQISFGIKAGVRKIMVGGIETNKERVFSLAEGKDDVHIMVNLNWENDNNES